MKNTIVLNVLAYLIGHFYFKITNKTLPFAFSSFTKLYWLTNGRINNFFTNLFYIKKSSKLILNERTIKINSSNLIIKNNSLDVLNKDGYVRLLDKLSNNELNNLIKFSYENLTNQNNYFKIGIPYTSKKYSYYESDLINNSTIQSLIIKESILSLAFGYLKTTPILMSVSMWWLTDFKGEESEDAGLNYHFDYDSPKWIKFFIYLTDVNEFNAPHCYIKKSHKQKPPELLKKGYARIQDSEMHEFYHKDDFITVKGKKGTILAGDTLCWHKGKQIIKGERLILVLKFSSSLFGLKYNKQFISNPTKEFKHFYNLNKNIFKKYKIEKTH